MLPRSAGDVVLLCTDLHAENVLASEREPWLAIDPKPFIGDPGLRRRPAHAQLRRTPSPTLPSHSRTESPDLLELDPNRVKLARRPTEREGRDGGGWIDQLRIAIATEGRGAAAPSICTFVSADEQDGVVDAARACCVNSFASIPGNGDTALRGSCLRRGFCDLLGLWGA